MCLNAVNVNDEILEQMLFNVITIMVYSTGTSSPDSSPGSDRVISAFIAVRLRCHFFSWRLEHSQVPNQDQENNVEVLARMIN